MRKRTKIFTVALCAIVVGSSNTLFASADHDPDSVQKSIVAEASSEDVIKAAYFGRGPLADLIDYEVQLPEEVDVATYDREVDNVVTEMKEADPEAFENVAEGITSGSIPQVAEALESGSELLNEVAGAESAEDLDVAQCPVAGAVCVAVAAVGAISWVVAQNAFIVTTVGGAWFAIGSVSVGDESGIQRDRYVKEIATKLAR